MDREKLHQYEPSLRRRAQGRVRRTTGLVVVGALALGIGLVGAAGGSATRAASTSAATGATTSSGGHALRATGATTAPTSSTSSGLRATSGSASHATSGGS